MVHISCQNGIFFQIYVKFCYNLDLTTKFEIDQCPQGLKVWNALWF